MNIRFYKNLSKLLKKKSIDLTLEASNCTNNDSLILTGVPAVIFEGLHKVLEEALRVEIEAKEEAEMEMDKMAAEFMRELNG